MNYNVRRVLAITTGGTIAATPGKFGLRPTEKKQDVISLVRKHLQKMKIVVEVKHLKPVDSTNMLTAHRKEIATIIFQNAHGFDGFVITHGTDTMVDTAAALTFMIQRLGKPIVLTGSQISAYKPRTDGINNMLAAFEIATQDFGEVLIAFGNHIIRGPRAIKYDEQGFNAFQSTRVQPIGKIGIDIRPHVHRIKRFNGDPILFTDFDTNIGFFHPMSGVDHHRFEDMVSDKMIHGLVVVGFGAGNISEAYYNGISMATKMNKPIIVVTQCLEGGAEMGIYEVGTRPLELGAISGEDMTMQTATQKLMYALGRIRAESIAPEEIINYVKRITHMNYAEEISKL
ncbi:asparaginase [Candidatus Micrarchaeota archaeon]|nr:asparaginase [Candidatus Micrarchaeota archaeon]